jgi:hypothetical protein
MKTTPTVALEALLNIEPLHIHIETQVRSALLRLKHSSLLINNTNYGHSSLWTSMITQSPELNMPCDLITPEYRFEKSFKIELPTRENWSASNVIPIESMTWFTDGSRRNELSGSGIFCTTTETEISVPLGKFITVFITEINAILVCCTEISTHHSSNSSPIYICSDI